jgi:hypothetical protein
MKSSHLRHLAFYGSAIGFVLGLFALVTNYGEAHLKTAQDIEGSYVFKLPASANCGSGEPSGMLTIQQSGVYIVGALTNPALPNHQSALKSLTLSGQWKNQQLSLAGEVPMSVLCASAKGKETMAVNIEGAIAMRQDPTALQKLPKSVTLTGTLSLDTAKSPLTAQRQQNSKEAK